MKKFLTILFSIIINFLCVSYAQTSDGSILYKKSVQSVVIIESQRSIGSGVIIDEEGSIATCFHVVDDADSITVRTLDGKKYKVNGYRYINPETDAAIVTVKADKKFTPINIKTDSYNIGDAIYALSNPKGLEFVFSDGIISRIDKSCGVQFTAPVSSGSSGGALLDRSGKLIGIISSQYSLTQAQNINFAVPITFYTPHLKDKKIINTKNQNWTEFLINHADKKQMMQYRKYATKRGDLGVLYKYIKPRNNKEEVKSEDFPFLGIMAMTAYINTNNDNALARDVRKWLTLSLLNNDAQEVSSYGLMLLELYESTSSNIDIYLEYLKKYPTTYKQTASILAQRRSCSENDNICYEKIYRSLNEYFVELSKNFFRSRKKI